MPVVGDPLARYRLAQQMPTAATANDLATAATGSAPAAWTPADLLHPTPGLLAWTVIAAIATGLAAVSMHVKVPEVEAGLDLGHDDGGHGSE